MRFIVIDFGMFARATPCPVLAQRMVLYAPKALLYGAVSSYAVVIYSVWCCMRLHLDRRGATRAAAGAYAISLRACYAVSGTDLMCSAVCAYALVT
eukprot:1017673-Rhodomonas_salina.1